MKIQSSQKANISSRRLKTFGTLLLFIFISFGQTGCTVLQLLAANSKGNKRKAEQKKKKEAAAAKSNAIVAKYKALISEKDCKKIKAGYNSSYSFLRYAMKQNNRTGDVKAALQLGKCGDWNTIFTGVLRTNQRRVNNVMNALVAAKLPVHREYDKWLGSVGVRLNGGQVDVYKFHWVRVWFSKTSKAKQHCQAYWKNRHSAVASAPAAYRKSVQPMFVGYLVLVKCHSFHDKIKSLMSSNKWKDRRQSCLIMGIRGWGRKSDIRTMQQIASTDSHSYIHRRVRIFPVRDSCRSAIGKIKIRS